MKKIASTPGPLLDESDAVANVLASYWKNCVDFLQTHVYLRFVRCALDGDMDNARTSFSISADVA
jgi:hypothetical protein